MSEEKRSRVPLHLGVRRIVTRATARFIVRFRPASRDGIEALPPAWQGVSPALLAGTSTLTLRPPNRRHFLCDALLIPIPNNPQPFQSQKLIHCLNMPRSPTNQRRLPSGGHHFRLRPHHLLHSIQN